MSLVIKKYTLAEAEKEPNFSILKEEYAKELIVAGAPPFEAKMELYYQLEKSGMWQGFAAFSDDVFIGFVTVLVTVLPHCGVLMAVTESLFVLKEYRKTYAGLKLIGAAERYAAERGSPCLLISAPSGGDLEKVLPVVGYKETNRIFFKDLKNV